MITAPCVATHPGHAEVWAVIEGFGYTKGWFYDDLTPISDRTVTVGIDVALPYSPQPPKAEPIEVSHGAVSGALLNTGVDTEDYGIGRGYSNGGVLGGDAFYARNLPPAANSGAHADLVRLHSVGKVHSGVCPYEPNHVPKVQLRFFPNSYSLDAYFNASPYVYRQEPGKDGSLLIPEFDASCLPLKPPCRPDEVYDPSQCKCVNRNVSLVPVPLGVEALCLGCGRTPTQLKVRITVLADINVQLDTPFTLKPQQGSSLTLVAPPTASLGGTPLRFMSWVSQTDGTKLSTSASLTRKVTKEETLAAEYQPSERG